MKNNLIIVLLYLTIFIIICSFVNSKYFRILMTVKDLYCQKNKDLIDFIQKQGMYEEMNIVLGENFNSNQHFSFSNYLESTPENFQSIVLWERNNIFNDNQGGGGLQNSFIGIGQLTDTSDKTAPYIVNLTVNKQYQKKGYGSKIVKLLERVALSQGHSIVRLNIDFEHLRPFYEGLGYREVKNIKNFLPHIATYQKTLTNNNKTMVSGGRKRWG